MKTQATVRTRNYRKFYALLALMPGGVPAGELKQAWVSDFTEGRTVHAQEMKEIEFSLMLAAMEQHITDNNPKQVKLDTLRKRVIAAIGAWLRERNKTENIGIIKAIACRAAQVSDFNTIPAGKLRALYEEWRNKRKVSVETDAVVGAIENELAMMN
jgi:hypothetical protein